MSSPAISVLCPFYNERENLEELYRQMNEACRGLPVAWEVLFIDDGSQDLGGDLLKQLIGSDGRFQVIRLNRNGGKSAALDAGFRSSRGEILATMDADLQDPPHEIPRMLSLLEGVDIVAGIRKKRKDSWFRRTVSKVSNSIRRAVLKDTIWDINCPLCVFRREALSVWLPLKGMHRFFLALAEAEGFRIRQVEVENRPRYKGRSKNNFRNRGLVVVLDLFGTAWLMRRKISRVRMNDKR